MVTDLEKRDAKRDLENCWRSEKIFHPEKKLLQKMGNRGLLNPASVPKTTKKNTKP